ncbi:hypothetical protein [Noviherbaspirillum sp.]|uniref:hypothetical protein n=1 Tax=Noviherbaspirillum sp. TaxID=1926288 RepID=UPI002FDFE97B
MNRLFLPVVVAVALSGCAVVSPYDQSYGTYSAHSYDQPYVAAPTYVLPAPVYGYGPPVYVGPPVHLNFGLNYRSGGGRHHGYGHRHHHFRGHGFHGGRHGGWRR